MKDNLDPLFRDILKSFGMKSEPEKPVTKLKNACTKGLAIYASIALDRDKPEAVPLHKSVLYPETMDMTMRSIKKILDHKNYN